MQGERRLEAALGALDAALGAGKVPWMLIGGLAVIARGVRRMTTDIDAVIQGGEIDIQSLLATLDHFAIAPRASNAVQFAEEHLVLLAVHRPTGVELDISLGFTGFEREALERRELVKFGDRFVPMARVEDLLVFKAIAARPKDIEDVSTMLLLHAEIDLARVRRAVHELAVLADEPQLDRGLEEAIENSRESRRSARTLTKTEQAPAPAKGSTSRSKAQRRKKR